MLDTRSDVRLDGPITSRIAPNMRELNLQGFLATNLSLLPCLLQLPVALRMNLLLPPSEHVIRRDVARGAVQTDVVVMLNLTFHQSARIIQR